MSYETIEPLLLVHFSQTRRHHGDRFSGYRHADALAKAAAENAMVRADGDGTRFVIEVEDILGALRR